MLAEEENWAEAERKESEQALQAALEAAGATRESGKYTFEHRRAGESTGEFYQRVAIFYRCLVGEGEYPTKTIEKAGAVPPATARRWVNEARRRGFLAATKRGRVSDVH